MTANDEGETTQDSGSRKIVYFEPGFGGHQLYYLELVVRYVMEAATPMTMVVCAHSDIVKALEIITKTCGDASGRVEFIAHSDLELQRMGGRNLFAKGLYLWNLAQAKALEEGADHLYISYFDQAIAGALLDIFRRKGRHTVSGLLFHPLQHYSKWTRRPGLKYRLRSAAKSIFYFGARLNRQVSTFFCLDDFYIEYLKERRSGAGKFVYLPDPAPTFLLESGDGKVPLANADQLEDGKKVSFLLFGSLQRRKGVLETLTALEYLPKDVAMKSSFHFVGKVAGDIKSEVGERLASLRAQRPDLDVSLTDAFVSDEELAERVAATDVILAPYQKFVGSSGVLIWAITFGKPVITQDFGYLGRYVTKENIGLSIDTTSPKVLAESVEKMISERAEFEISPSNRDRLLSRQSPDAFCSILMEHWQASGSRRVV